MNLVDSSGWLEYFSDGPNADSFAKPLQDLNNLIVPTICIYEVFKVILRERSEDDALQAAALMEQGQVVDLTSEIAIQAAKISFEYKIPMADNIILTTARFYNAIVLTQDNDLEKFQDVKYISKSIKNK
ncbi:twitching motility protein PilT [bacterium SM23_31]|nr:MAG: twitching motility protein PilT [bacterium SM23_31]